SGSVSFPESRQLVPKLAHRVVVVRERTREDCTYSMQRSPVMYRRFMSLLVLTGLVWGAVAAPSSATDSPSQIMPLDEEKPAERQHQRVGLLSNQAAWQRLPDALQGTGQPLATWARALAAMK